MNEADIPIDIHVNKLQEWLISRRIVDKNWFRHVRDIRNAISEAIKDMPAHEDLIKLLSGSHINYFHCRQIVDILKTTEKDTKSLFGSYSSQRMKNWQEVLKMYEKDCVYLGEAAQILVRNVSYEVPSMKKQISKFEQSSDEATKKVSDSIKSENILRNEYNVSCQQLGIKGENVKRELTEKLKDLPELQEKVASKVPDLKKAVALYENFSGKSHCLPLMRHLIKSGNTTVYEYLYSEPSIKIEEPALDFNLEQESDNNEIDFGDNQEIDFGTSGGEIDYGNVGSIDFGDSDVNLVAGDIDWGGNVEVANNDAEIDFNISLEESGIVVESDGMTGGVAKGEEAFTILDSPQYRENFLDELFEVESFLKMRLFELSTKDKVQIISMSLLDSFVDHDAKTVTNMIGYVGIVITCLTSSLIQQLFQIKHSPKYVDILAKKLKNKLQAIEKLQLSQKLLAEKSIDLKKQSVELKPNLAKIIEQTKVLQKHIEQDISKRYKNRVVNLMGGNL